MAQSDASPTNDRQRYLKGITLFNQRKYFEAHEVWENLWKTATGKDKLFYQGLIQCAISLEHMKRGNAAGARTLFRRCHGRMAPLPRRYMGLEIWSLMEATARALAPRIDPPGKTSSTPIPWPTIALDPGR